MLAILITSSILLIFGTGLFFWQRGGIDVSDHGRTSVFLIYIILSIIVISAMLYKADFIYHIPEGKQYVSNDPVQVNFSEDESEKRKFVYKLDKSITLKPLASYDISGLVLDRNLHFKGEYDADDYLFMDLGLGWKELSDPFYVYHDGIEFSNRFYYLSFRIKKGYPLTYDDIDYVLSNTHILAKNKRVQKELKQVKKGRIVRLKGYLVQIIRDGYVSRTSSLVRTDGGNGACEAMYVTDVDIIEKGSLFSL